MSAVKATMGTSIGWRIADRARTQPCESNYCQNWDNDPNGDRLSAQFQLEFTKVGYDLLGGEALMPYLTGNSTTVGSSQLIDSGASFATPPIAINDIVVNSTSGEQSKVASVGSPTAVNIDDDIFGTGTAGDGYAFVHVRLPGTGVLYNATFERIQVSPAVGGSTFVISDVFPNTTNRFCVEVDIADYQGGRLLLSSGSYPVTFTSTFDEAAPETDRDGTFSFFGVPAGNDLQFQLSETANFKITGIRCYYIARPKVHLFQDDTEIDSYDPDSYVHNYAQFTVDLYAQDSGCYQLYANNVNGLVGRVNFPLQDNPPWELTNIGTGWSFISNELVNTAGGSSGTNTAEYTLAVPGSRFCNHVIQFRLDGASDKPGVEILTPDGYVDVSAYISGASGPTYYINVYGYTIQAVRFYATEVDSVTIEQFNVYETYYNEGGGYFTPGGDEEISDFRIAPEGCALAACLNIQPLSKDWLLLQGEIVNNQFGPRKINGRYLESLDDEGQILESVYLKADLRHASYDDDGYELNRGSRGNTTLTQSFRRKILECRIAPVPEWAHDFVAWATRTEFTINATRFFATGGGYSPNWQQQSADAGAVLQVTEDNQDTQVTTA